MRILHISRTMGQGGAEKVVYQLCRDNKKQQQFVISDGGAYVEKLKKIGVHHYIIPDITSKNPIIMIWCFIAILMVVKKEKIQIIHSHHRMAAFYARLVAYLVPVKLVYTAHNVFFNKRKLLKFALCGTVIVAVGEGVKNNLINYYKIPSSRINMVYNSVSDIFTGEKNEQLCKAKKHGQYLVGTIGRISKQKGIDIFIRAIQKFSLNKKNVLGVVIGTGDQLDKMKNLADTLSISNKILFLGYQRNVLDIIRQLDIIVLASRWEGLPLTPIEAFSQGKTVIATNISGNNEIIHDEYDGLLFTKDSVDGLVTQLKRTSSDPYLLEMLEHHARQTFEKRYQYHQFIDGYNKVYKWVLVGGKNK